MKIISMIFAAFNRVSNLKFEQCSIKVLVVELFLRKFPVSMQASGINATDKTPMTETLLTYAFGVE